MGSGKSVRSKKLNSAAAAVRKRLRRPHCAAITARSTSAPSQGKLTLLALRREKMPPHFAYAYQSTGLIVTEENEDYMDPQDVSRWYAAALEYFEAERRAKVAIAPAASLGAAALMAYGRATANGE